MEILKVSKYTVNTVGEYEIINGKEYIIKDNKIPNDLVDNFIVEKKISTERIFGKLGTVMHYKLMNGFTGVEHTSCVDEINYNEEIGSKILENRLKEKIWFGLGFALGMSEGDEK